jgi:transcriptional regulator with XRE-family HTH domain
MDDVALGRRFRAVRHRLHWRQVDVASRAGVSQDRISRIERGRAGQMSRAELRKVANALDAEFVEFLRWRGGDLERLVDEGHARLVGSVATLLRELGWIVRPEVTYAIYGERGSIDLLAWHPRRRVLLVIEVKTELVSIEETLRKHDEKARLAARIAEDRFGWRPDHVARALILPSLSTPRRRVARQSAVFDAAYPLRGLELRRWLRDPVGSAAGILFVDDGHDAGSHHGRARKRIRRRGTRAAAGWPGTRAAAVGGRGDQVSATDRWT